MTISGVLQQSQMNLFDERVEIIWEELELAIQWNRPSVLLVVYNSEYVRADAETVLKNFLIERGQKIVHIQMDETPDIRFHFTAAKISNSRRSHLLYSWINP